MSDNWIMPLDMLASEGVLDYDAPADILGVTPRYYGHPDLQQIPNLLPPDIVPKNSPKQDVFEPNTPDNSMVHNPSWKKWLFGASLLGVTALGILSFALSKGKIKLPDKIAPSLKTFSDSALNILKTPFKWLSKKTPKS